MKKIFGLIYILIFAIALVGCAGEVENKDEDETPKVEETAVQKLDANEKAIYEALTKNISDFIDPASVKLVKINESFWNNKALIVRLSATTKSGSTGMQDYLLFVENITVQGTMLNTYSTAHYVKGTQTWQSMKTPISAKKGDMVDVEEVLSLESGFSYLTGADRLAWELLYFKYNFDEVPSISIAKINNALDEYKVDQGLK